MIREEPERNLFLECIQSTNQPPTARDLPAEPRRRSARNSHSTPSQSTPQQSTPSPSPVEDNPKKKKSIQRIQQSTRAPSPNGKAEHPSNLLAAGENTPTKRGFYKIHKSLNDSGQNENFQEWLREKTAGHTQHQSFIEWLTERIDDNRQLSKELEQKAAWESETQQRGRRLIAGLSGWGKGLYTQPVTSVVIMSENKQEVTPVQSEMGGTLDPITSSEGPLLSGSIPPGRHLLPGTVTQFPQEFHEEGTESDRSDKSIRSDAGVDATHSVGRVDDEDEDGGDNAVNYNSTSSEEEIQQPASTIQPHSEQLETIQQSASTIQPHSEQLETIQPPASTIQPPCEQEAVTNTINPPGQDEYQNLIDTQSTHPTTLENQINPTGLTPTQWEKQKSIFSRVLEGYTSPGGNQVNIHNLMMLAFTQSRLDGENQFNIMAQNHVHFNYAAQQQKELLEQQAATIQAGTELVLAAQKRMLETMDAKQQESQKVNDSRVAELMERLTAMEMALTREKVKCLEFEAALAIERQNKRRATHSPENA